jgi:hypothetical protein
MPKSDEADHTASLGHGNNDHAKSDQADHITFTRIADFDTEIPNQPGSNFLHFGTFPSVDKQGEVAFGESITQFGNIVAIYVGSGDELQLVADLNTVLPSNPGTIANFADPVIEQSHLPVRRVLEHANTGKELQMHRR